jgi:hypothetical protein
VKTLEHFHKYLYKEDLHLRTDHSALTCAISSKNLEEQSVRWIRLLQECNSISDHHKGRKQNNVDPLSRRPCRDECTHFPKVELLCPMETHCCEEWHTRAPLGIRRRIISPRSRVNDVLTELHGRPSGNLGVNRTLTKVWQMYYWHQEINDREVVPAVRHLCSQSRPPNQESGPNASVECRGLSHGTTKDD